MRQKRPTIADDDMPFQDDEDDLLEDSGLAANLFKGRATTNLSDLHQQQDFFDRLEARNPQDSIKQYSPQKPVEPSLLKSSSQVMQRAAPTIAQGNPFTMSNRMTMQQPKSMGGFGGLDEPFSGSVRGTIQTKPKEETNIFISKEQDPPVAFDLPKVIPTPLPLEEPHLDKASESSGTPEFKWGAGGANAQLPSIDDDKEGSKLLEQMDQVESQQSQSKQMLANSHISMQITSKTQLQFSAARKNRDSGEVVQKRQLDSIIDEDEEEKVPQIPAQAFAPPEKPVFSEILLPDEDPHNYLSELENPKVHLSSHQNLEESKEQVIAEPQDQQLVDDGYNSDQSYSKEFYLIMHDDITSPQAKKKLKEPMGLTLEEQGYKNVIRIIDWNERRHQYNAKHKLKQHSELSTALALQDQNFDQNINNMRVMTTLNTYNSITKKLEKERQYSQARATALGMSDDLLFIGNSEGQVWMFDRNNEDEYDSFSDKSKEFLGNSVTAIDIHQLRSEYVVLGYERGQIVLFDATEPKKSVKTIKDHHSGASIVDIKFCDWRGNSSGGEKQGEQSQPPDEDRKAWMFISIDSLGRIIVNTVTKKLIMMAASKYVIIDPTKNMPPVFNCKFNAISSRFHSQIHGQGIYDDYSMTAIGSNDRVLIGEAKASNYQVFFTLHAPSPLPKDYPQTHVALSWGHGMTPNHMDRPHSMLAVGWGPLIQIVVLIDHEERDKPFIHDGYFILRQIKSQNVMQQPSANDSMVITQQLRRKALGLADPPEAVQKEEEKSSVAQDEKDAQQLVNPLDESVNLSELSIEQIQFLSDSTLILTTSSAEVRVVHTHSFVQGSYDPLALAQPDTRNNILLQIKNAQADLDSGIGKVPMLLRGDFTRTYAQSIKFFQGRLAFLTQKNVQNSTHMTWQQSIYEYKKQVHDDLIQVFSRAISIFKGKVKGYRGLLDHSFLRENILKGELKHLVKEIIQQVVEKTKLEADRIITDTLNQAKPLMDSEGEESKSQIAATLAKLDQFEDEKRKKFETLIRIAIEFCVELKDSDFLFKDLFWVFQEEKIEKLFVQELEPFIMAGKLNDWELPNEVIQNHVIKYYKDPSRAEALEKIIVNLNLKRCPKTIILEFIHFAELHYLTTAILFLYTQVYEKRDNTSCQLILCSLFDLYKKANKKNLLAQLKEPVRTKSTPQGESSQAAQLAQAHHYLVDIASLKDASYDSFDKLQIERSQTYLGYKILWTLNLFIDGKKFPVGSIREKMWNAYLHDIIEFLANQEYLKILLSIDAESVFQIISVLFFPSLPGGPHGPYELLQMGRIEDNQAQIIDEDLKKVPIPKDDTAHWRFIKVLDMYCIRPETPEAVKLQYYYFVAKVISRSPAFQGFDHNCFFFVLKELLVHHKKYLEFVKKLYEQSKRQKKIRQLEALGEKIDDDSLRTFPSTKERERDSERIQRKVEKDLIRLIRKSEPLDKLMTEDIFKFVDKTTFNKVKTEMLEKKEMFIESLRTLLHSSQASNGDYLMQWIEEKLRFLQEKASGPDASVYNKNTYESFKREVTQNYKTIVAINVDKAILLVKQCLGDNHKDIIDQLSRDGNEQLAYIDRLLELQEQDIKDVILKYIHESINPVEAKKCLEVLKLHIKLTCIHKPLSVLEVIERHVVAKGSCYPIEDCLQICQEHKQHEAVFLLSKKLNKYFDCISQGVTYLREKVDYQKMQVEIFYSRKNSIALSFQMPKSKKAEAEARAVAAAEAKAVVSVAVVVNHRQPEQKQAQQYPLKPVFGLLSKDGKVFKESQMISVSQNPLVEQIKVKEVVEVSKQRAQIPPQIKAFDNIYGRMLKICQNHSKEVDQKHEETIWFMVVDVVIEQLRPLGLKREYCREFFEDRFYAFIEIFVKIHRDGFQRLFDYLLRQKKIGSGSSLHFSDLSQVILKMFGDQRSEKVVLKNANNSIMKVNSEIFQEFSQQSRFGVLFRQRQCQGCKRFIDSFLYDDIIQTGVQEIADEEMLEYDPFSSNKGAPNEGQKIKVFACCHIYHIRCLKNKYMNQFGQTPDGKQDVIKMFKVNQERLRCITCNLNNLDILGKEGVKKAGFQATAQPAKSVPTATPVPEEGIEDENDDDDQRARAGPSSVMLRSQSLMNKRLGRLQKKMDDFERFKVTDGVLCLNDFKNN